MTRAQTLPLPLPLPRALGLALALALPIAACSSEDSPDAGTVDAATDASIPDVGVVDANVDGGPTPDPYLYYPLDGNADEGTGTGKDGLGVAISGAPDRDGTPNGALHFDSATSVVTISPIELRPPYTVALWWSRDGAGPRDPGCLGGEVTSILFAGYRFLIALGADDRQLFYAIENDDPPPLLVPALATTTATTGWHHVAIVDDVDRGELWLDGRRVASSTIASEPPRHASFLVLGGHPAYPCGLQGSIDDVHLHARVLDAAEITALAER